jgi:hypothetical protein
MPLPKIDLPLFETNVPSTEEKIRFRPFTVKEEKNLLIAQESKDYDQMVLSIQQLLTNCIAEDIDIEKLALFDIEYLMLQIRGKSINNVIEFRIKDPDTEEQVDLEMDIDKITVEFPENDYRKINISDDYMINMRYPSIKEMYMMKNFGEEAVEQLFKMMISCITNVVNQDQIYQLADFSDKEVMDFVDDLPNSAIQKIRRFFENMPRVTYLAEWKNAEGEDKSVKLEGLDNFFT